MYLPLGALPDIHLSRLTVTRSSKQCRPTQLPPAPKTKKSPPPMDGICVIGPSSLLLPFMTETGMMKVKLRQLTTSRLTPNCPPPSRSRSATGDTNDEGRESRNISPYGVADDVVPLAAVSAVCAYEQEIETSGANHRLCHDSVSAVFGNGRQMKTFVQRTLGMNQAST